MKNKKLVIIAVLIFYSLIIIGSADDINALPDNVKLKNEAPLWGSFTTIITPFGDSLNKEIIIDIHVPKNGGTILKDLTNIENKGNITSEVEYFLDDEKKDFNQFFRIESNGENSQIIQKKYIYINKTTNIKLIYNIKSISKDIFIEENATMLKVSQQFYFRPDDLFARLIFRVPVANSHNMRINFEDSKIGQTSKNNFIPVPVTNIYQTDKYLEMSYIFWNIDKFNQIVDENKTSAKPFIMLQPSNEYSLQTTFLIGYETIRNEWLMAIALSSIVATSAFIGGALWGKRKKD